jgi:hypothetical protein
MQSVAHGAGRRAAELANAFHKLRLVDREDLGHVHHACLRKVGFALLQTTLPGAFALLRFEAIRNTTLVGIALRLKISFWTLHKDAGPSAPNVPRVQSQASRLAPAESRSPAFLDCAADLDPDSLQQTSLRRFHTLGIDFVQPEQHLFPPLPLQEIADCQREEPAAAQPHHPRSFVRFLQ